MRFVGIGRMGILVGDNKISSNFKRIVKEQRRKYSAGDGPDTDCRLQTLKDTFHLHLLLKSEFASHAG